MGGLRFVRKNWRVLGYSSKTSSGSFSRNNIFLDYNLNLELLKNWPIPSNSVDLICCSHTLEHLSDKAYIKTLQEIYRVLKGGVQTGFARYEFSY